MAEDQNPSIISHVSIGTDQFDRAIAFYDAIMPTLGGQRLATYPGAVAYGKRYPEFWLHTPIDGAPATVGNGTHVGFLADTQAAVHAFYAAALAAGGVDDGPPGGRSDYGAAYYGCFIRDPDGHKIEAMFWDEQLEP
jgi:catechol 2,3-dioxygenase-like lactoylglutathione lyase family enzyme